VPDTDLEGGPRHSTRLATGTAKTLRAGARVAHTCVVGVARQKIGRLAWSGTVGVVLFGMNLLTLVPRASSANSSDLDFLLAFAAALGAAGSFLMVLTAVIAWGVKLGNEAS
jgi:hypothetical protein